MSPKLRPPLTLLVSAITVALGLLAFGGDRALAGAVACGDTITADLKLKADLVNCPNNGLLIGADNVEIDLNGHTIDGNGKNTRPCPRGELCDHGMAIEGHDHVTVSDGRFTGFLIGVDVFDARGIRLLRLDASRNTVFGVGVFQAREVRMRRVDATHNLESGILFVGVVDSEVRASSAIANGLDTDQAGMSMFESSGVRIARSSLSHNGDIGLFSESLTDVRIAHNRIVDNPEAGVFTLESNGGALRANRISRVGDGIIVTGNRNRIARNRIFRIEAPPECDRGCGVGVSMEEGRRNRIVRNRVARAGAAGIRLGVDPGLVPATLRTRENLVRGNRLVRNHDGVLVESNAVDSLLIRNRARRSHDDGIDVRRPATTLIGNRANDNADLGVEAVSGVTDGTGNRARDNGDPRQCLNVACG